MNRFKLLASAAIVLPLLAGVAHASETASQMMQVGKEKVMETAKGAVEQIAPAAVKPAVPVVPEMPTTSTAMEAVKGEATKKMVEPAAPAATEAKKLAEPAAPAMEKAKEAVAEVAKPAGPTPVNVVAAASGNPELKTLTSLIKEAGLTETLQGKGPFTVFAPNDAAFGKLSSATLTDLKKPENKEQLKKILTYHVVQGNMMTVGFADSTTMKETVEGQKITIKGVGKDVTVNNAKVVGADMAVGNGVVHVIDTVLMPPPVVATKPASPTGTGEAAAETAKNVMDHGKEMVKEKASQMMEKVAPAVPTVPAKPY
jgi:uncharacterized surface protein with fasciclin (FAS1) repeats